MDTASLVDTHISHIHTYISTECERFTGSSLLLYTLAYIETGDEREHAGQTFSLCKCRHICKMYVIYIDVGISFHTLFS